MSRIILQCALVLAFFSGVITVPADGAAQDVGEAHRGTGHRTGQAVRPATSARAQAGTGAQAGSGRGKVIDTPAPRCLTTRVGSRPRIGWRCSRTMVCRGRLFSSQTSVEGRLLIVERCVLQVECPDAAHNYLRIPCLLWPCYPLIRPRNSLQ